MTRVVQLTSPGGARARIQTELGFNLFDWESGGRERLWAHEDFAGGNERPSGSGIPILFPFPGRIAGGRYDWDGQEYTIESDDGRGNAIHGFVYNRPWQVEQLGADAVIGRFRASEVDAAILQQWPADFELQVQYHLEDSALRSTFTARAIDRPLPAGLGLHPYFRVPMDADHDVTLQAPFVERWPLENMNPTGAREAVVQPFEAGVAVAKQSFDDVFSVANTGTSWHEATVRWEAAGKPLGAASNPSIQIRWSGDFPHCVVYTPPHREAICIEPYSCIPNAVAQPDANRRTEYGLRVIEPGETWQARVDYLLS